MTPAERRLSLVRLRKVVRYDPATGDFLCLINRRKARVGTKTGVPTKAGYIQVTVDGVIYLGHRLAWFYMTGTWPGEIDHRNLDKSDNRWENLRRATRTQNSINKPPQSNNTSGYKGVAKSANRWRAYITVKRKQIHLGTAATPAEAHALYVSAAKRYYGEFARAA